MDRGQKEELVASMHQTFEKSAMVVVTHYSGLTVAELGVLRSEMRAAGASFKVTKNRLTRRAIDGTQFSPLARCLLDRLQLLIQMIRLHPLRLL